MMGRHARPILGAAQLTRPALRIIVQITAISGGEAMRYLLLAASVLALAACGKPQTGPAGGASIADASAAAQKAADQLVSMAGDSAHSGKPPRATDAAAAPLLDKVFDTKSLAGVTPSSDQS